MPFSRRHASQHFRYRMDGGSAALAWFVAESLFQLLLRQPDELLGAEYVQMLADSLRAYYNMSHSDGFASEGAAVPCRNFALARIDAGIPRGEPARTDRSGLDRGRVTTRASWARIWVRIYLSC